jgi:hypothetical protein
LAGKIARAGPGNARYPKDTEARKRPLPGSGKQRYKPRGDKLFLLQAQTPTDFSWLSQMGEVALAILGIITIAVIFIKRGLPKYWEYKKDLARIAAEKEKTTCGNLQERRETELKKITELLIEDAEKRESRQAEVDKKFNELDAGLNGLKNAIAINDKLTEKAWEMLLKVSEDNQYSIFINKDADIVERLKALRILIAFERNGDVKTLGFALILQHKKKPGGGVDPWRQAEKCKLPVPVKNQKYWDDTMAEINRRIYDGF